jgi:hypothetical protein
MSRSVLSLARSVTQSWRGTFNNLRWAAVHFLRFLTTHDRYKFSYEREFAKVSGSRLSPVTVGFCQHSTGHWIQKRRQSDPYALTSAGLCSPLLLFLLNLTRLLISSCRSLFNVLAFLIKSLHSLLSFSLRCRCCCAVAPAISRISPPAAGKLTRAPVDSTLLIERPHAYTHTLKPHLHLNP